MAEQTYYQDSKILITNARVVLEGTTYAVPTISSVRLADKLNIGWAIPVVLLMLYLGFLWLFQVISIFSGYQFFEKIIVTVILGGILYGLGRLVLNLVTLTYILIIVTTSTEIVGFKSKDGKYMNTVLNAINQAIITRSRV